MRVTLEIEGMNCGHCVKAVTESLAILPGLTSLEVAVGRASFELAGSPDEAALRSAIEDAGFTVSSVTVAPRP